MRMRATINWLKLLLKKMIDDDITTLAASLSFYTALSLSPLLVIITWVCGSLGSQFSDDLIAELVAMVGPQAGEALRIVVKSAGATPTLATASGLLSLGFLLISAGAVFGQLQHSLNLIWKVSSTPHGSFLEWIRKRLISMGMVVVLGFLLLVSLVVSTAISTAVAYLPWAAVRNATMWQIVDLVISFAAIGGMFAAIFRYLPDRRLQWRHVLGGATVTAIMFILGKWGIAAYIARSSFSSAYGAAGSLLALLVWVYYSSIIVFLGAEITEGWMPADDDPALSVRT